MSEENATNIIIIQPWNNTTTGVCRTQALEPKHGLNSDLTPTSHITLTLVKLLNFCTSVFFIVKVK